MKHLLTIFLIIFLPYVAMADKVDRALITYQNTPGYFFSIEIGDKILKDLESLSIIKQQDVLLKEKISLLDTKLEIKDLNIKTTEQIADKWKSAHDVEVKLRFVEQDVCNKKLNAKDAWYRSPVFWTFVGLVVGAGLSIGVAFGVNESK